MPRFAIAKLSTNNLLHNLSVIKKKANHCRVIAMIKANAYGHGLRSTAKILEAEVDSLGVASIDEAKALREIGIKIPIILMSGAFEIDDLIEAAIYNFQPVFHNFIQINWLKQLKLNQQLNIWLKIDTGMHRLGYDMADFEHVYEILSSNSQLNIVGIMSHLACADNYSHPLNHLQLNNFRSLIESKKNLKSIANSAAIFNFSNQLYDVVRPGLALYGISPIKNKTACELDLKPVMTLQTRLTSVRMIKADEAVGYNSIFIAKESMLIGVAAIGYGDGYPRTARNGTPVIVNGFKCQIIGQVSMDMIMIDLNNAVDPKIGDLVTLWGEGLPIEEVASCTNNIAYDLLCGVQHRVRFNWQ